jgi:AdoMet-dependent rRNA methyltransferase SPB1
MVNDGKSTKRKKFHDKDKYYKLAKEQGLRSRAAFKLSQINRQYPILQKARVVLDLCAAPGGWTQIAARNCGPQTQIVAVDILPIRSLGNRNITTIVGDITTEKCKAEIKRAIPTSNNKNDDKGNVDVVLHDGAPNVGGAFEKDAYEQIELSVHALRCATQHLRKGGTFITKIYRSRDSASFQWVVQQLFEEVTSFKPKASRQQSAEIFYVCQNYYKPDKIDPRLLDPKHIFEFVEGDTTGASTPQASANYHVFHKSWDSAKRHRDGYDTEHLDATLRHVEPLNNFVQTKGRLDAIRLLSQCTAFSFACEECKDNNKSTTKKDAPSSCHCQFYLHHPLTTPEIKECVVDLKVLNKGDFKGIMIWRERMILTLEEQRKDVEKKEDVDDDSSDEEQHAAPGGAANDEEEEDQIQREIKELRERKVREKKRIKKKGTQSPRQETKTSCLWNGLERY